MKTRRILQGLGALLVLVGILVGLPALLATVGGNPLPKAVPSLDQIRAALLSPDDGALVLTGAVLLGWLVWAALAASIVVEVAWQLRGIRAPHLPGLTLPQATVRGLVTAVLALFIAAPLGMGGTASAVQTVPLVAATTLAAGTEAVQSVPADRARDAPTAGTTTYIVQAGDTLWSIAEKHLGSGREYHRIVDLNRDQLREGADWVTPGLVLTVPFPTREVGHEQPEGQLVVTEGGHPQRPGRGTPRGRRTVAGDLPGLIRHCAA